MIGYKAFNKDLTCRGFQYEIGQTYSMEKSPVPCERGFHFCKSIAETYKYYKMSDNTRICKIEALGEVQIDGDKKCCTNVIKILDEITEDWECKGNSNSSNSGFCNSGDMNSGDMNSGDRNSGNWNSGNWNSGLFNTEKNPKIKIFDKDSDWSIEDWYRSGARDIMDSCPCTYSNFICESDMTEEEKENHPEYKITGGYTKIFVVTKEDKEKWWNDLPDTDKNVIRALPNFDFDKFRQCVGF